MSQQPALARRLGTGDAVIIGLGSMIGAGIFAAFAPAAQAAGAGLLVGLAIAAFVAICNATASAQLAAQYPTSGGTYVYGRERLGEWSGFVAGWSFVVGKTASIAAMALTFAAYVAPIGWGKPVAIACVVLLVAVNSFGITRTARLARLIVIVVLVTLVLVVSLGVTAWGSGGELAVGQPNEFFAGGVYGTLQSAGILFFAFAGYARIATLGEEVRNPSRTIPRAIIAALATTLVIYTLVALVALVVLGPNRIAASSAPLLDVARAGGSVLGTDNTGWIVPVVMLGAAAASLGALLALVAGVGRTSLAMARNADLPRSLATVNAKYQVPRRAEFTLAFVAISLILVTDLRGAIGFSSFGVLLYYFVTNAAAFTQDRSHRRYPRALQVCGAFGCLLLVATLPPTAIMGGIGVVVAGVFVRLISRKPHDVRGRRTLLDEARGA